MTVGVADAHARGQRLVSVVKMAAVLEECTTEEQRSDVRFFCGQKHSMQRIFKKKYFLCYGEKCLSRKAVHNCVANVSLMTKRLKRRRGNGWVNSQRLLCCGFWCTGKAIGQSVSMLVEDMSRNKRFFFFHVCISHFLRFISICDPFTDSPS
jgi:hypothetical protein